MIYTLRVLTSIATAYLTEVAEPLERNIWMDWGFIIAPYYLEHLD